MRVAPGAVAMDTDALEQIRAAVRRGVEGYWTAEGTFAIPMLVVLASAARVQRLNRR